MENKSALNKNKRNIIIAVVCIVAAIVGVVLFNVFQKKKAEAERQAAWEETQESFTVANMQGLWVTKAEDGSTRRFLIYYSDLYERWFLRTDYFWDSSTDQDGMVDAECSDSYGGIFASGVYGVPGVTDGIISIHVRQTVENYNDDPIEVELIHYPESSRITIQRDKNWNSGSYFNPDMYIDMNDYSLMLSNHIRKRATDLVESYYGMRMSPDIVEYDRDFITINDFVDDQGYVSGSIDYTPATDAFATYRITFQYDPVRDDFYDLYNYNLWDRIVFQYHYGG